MSKLPSIQALLWLDCSAAFLAAATVLALRPALSQLCGLPASLLLAQAVITLGYGCYSFTLAARRVYQWRWIRLLAVANLAYASLSLALLVGTWGQTSPVGKAYFAAEVLFIATLGMLEYRQRNFLPR